MSTIFKNSLFQKSNFFIVTEFHDQNVYLDNNNNNNNNPNNNVNQLNFFFPTTY